jgi:hypothetical protein
MGLSLMQLTATGVGGTEDAAAVIDVPEDGHIVGVQWAAYATFDATAENLTCELSFIATNTIATNDARGMISQVRSRFNVVTSGGGASALNFFVPIPELEVAGGERLYLHLIAAAGLASSCTAIVHLLTSRAGVIRRARRRT